MLNILEMLYAGVLDAYFFGSDLKRTHQCKSIVVCTVCCSESRHCDTYYTLTWQSQLIESLYTHKKSQCRIQTSGYSYYHSLAVGVHKSFCKSCHLNGKNLLASFVKKLSACRNKRMRIDISCKREFATVYKFSLNMLYVRRRVCPDTGSKCGIYKTLATQTFHIYLAGAH